jgi:hypothetical protein
MGDEGAIRSLTDQIEDIDLQLQENVAALKSNTIAIRNAEIERITGRGSFIGGVFGSLNQIVTTLGNLTGRMDIPKLVELARSTGVTLKETGTSLRKILFQDFGIDLLGKTSEQLIEIVRGLNFDQIMANFSPEQRTQFEGLINAILENENAVIANTQSIEELNGHIDNSQSFNSESWEKFRVAIFDGMGGLLPRLVDSLPHMAEGGHIYRDGPYYLHAGEDVISPTRTNVTIGNQAPTVHDESVNIHVEKGDEVSEERLAQRVSYARSHKR